MSRTQKAFVEIIAILAIIVVCGAIVFANPVFAQAKLDPNLSQGQAEASSLPTDQENSPATAQYSQYDQYSQYGVVELPDTGGPNLLAAAVVVGIVMVAGGGVVLRLLKR
jgi:LPXTG-motif cell wall-anchored protein